MNSLKRILTEVINNLEYGDILSIHYKGFVGRGLNGASNNVAYLSKQRDTKVNEWETFYSTKMQKNYISHQLLEDCIKISSNDINIARNVITDSITTYIPYNMITSFEVKHKNKLQ